MITDIILAFLGVGSKIYTSLGMRSVPDVLHDSFTSLWTSDIQAIIQRFFSLFFYFFPKDVVITIISVFITVLIVRIVLSIVAEVWFG